MIQVQNLTKRYGRVTVVDSLTFGVAKGETLALRGDNGTGKSTTLKCLLGLIPFEGSVEICGHDVQRSPREARRLIGYVPQEMPVFDMTVGEALAFFAGVRGVTPAGVRLSDAGLSGSLAKPIRALSGGMRQRLALALALLGDPAVLLLDEPTANLDETARQEFLALLLRLREQGKTMVIASHRSDEVNLLADSSLVLGTSLRRAAGAEGR
ncbi:MAG: ABC transporter ATP-binding protein [Bacillota bacterium]